MRRVVAFALCLTGALVIGRALPGGEERYVDLVDQKQQQMPGTRGSKPRRPL